MQEFRHAELPLDQLFDRIKLHSRRWLKSYKSHNFYNYHVWWFKLLVELRSFLLQCYSFLPFDYLFSYIFFKLFYFL